MAASRFVVGLCLILMGCEAALAAERPNIVLILADDVGWGDIRANNPNGQVALPTLERLSSEGIRFTNAHTSAAKCAPSRYSIITGNYQWRGRFGWGTWNYKGGSQILPGQETLGHLAKRAGYSTAFVGKYHLGAEFFSQGSNAFASESLADTSVDFSRAMVDGPGDKGFDYSFVAMRGIQEGPYAFFENDTLVGNSSQLVTWQVGNYGDTKINVAGIGLPNWNTRAVGPTLLSKATAFLETHHSSQNPGSEPAPFFLLLSTEAIHTPYKPPTAINDRLVLGTSGLGLRTDMLVELDVIVDNVLRKLEQLAVLEDTLIIFASDNGANRLTAEQQAGHQSTGGFRGQKGTIYEGGHRVPLIMKWGPQAFGNSPLPRGRAIDALVGIQDVYATLADLTDISLPDDQGRDSFSLLPLLMGQAGAARDHMVNEADERDGSGGIPGRHFAYRRDPWKLVFDSARQPVGLYNLEVDPFETTNLRSQPEQSGRVAAMKSGLENALASARTAPPIGTPLVSVPDVTGLPRAVAESAILDADLVIGTVIEQVSASVPSGSVISQDPIGQALAAVGSPVNLAVSIGGIPVPQYSLSPASIAFGGQALNLDSSVRLVTLSSNGGSTLSISSIAISGTNPGQFSQSHNCGPTLAPGSACLISIRFRPTSGGSKTAFLTVAAADGAGTKQVALTGTGVKSAMSVSPTSLSFGDQARGTASAARTVMISNTGTVILPITSIKIGGPSAGQFRQTNNCPAQVPVGGNCIASVTFNPTSRGAKTASLNIKPAGGAAASAVALSGNGT